MPDIPSSHLTPAFSVSMQSNVPRGSAGQSRSLDSLPTQATLSNWIVPTEFVKPVVRAAAPAMTKLISQVLCASSKPVFLHLMVSILAVDRPLEHPNHPTACHRFGPRHCCCRSPNVRIETSCCRWSWDHPEHILGSERKERLNKELCKCSFFVCRALTKWNINYLYTTSTS